MLEVYELLVQAFQVVLAPLDIAAVQLPAEPCKPAGAAANSAALRVLVQVLKGQLQLLGVSLCIQRGRPLAKAYVNARLLNCLLSITILFRCILSSSSCGGSLAAS